MKSLFDYEEPELPAPDEWRDYTISRFWKMSDLHIRIQGVPPCFHCGVPVISPSCDGPLICGSCDCGRNADGTRKTDEQYKANKKHFGMMIDAYETDESRELRRKNGEDIRERPTYLDGSLVGDKSNLCAACLVNGVHVLPDSS